MSIHAIFRAVGDVLDVRGGYPFRGPIAARPDGAVCAVQMKDMDPFDGVDWRATVRTTLGGRGQAQWLQADDLLFVARGTRFYAICIDAPPAPAVCGPHLFHLRVKDGQPLLPAFVAWQMNQQPFQGALQRAAEGSSQRSVRRPVLEALVVGIPSLADQRRVVELARLVRRERQLHLQLARNRERMFESIAGSLRAETSPP
jgi:hypothetical protein